MANTITSKVIDQGPRNYIIARHNDSDGTAEALATFVDVTTFSDYNVSSAPMLSCGIEAAWLATTGSMTAKLYWAATTNKLAWLFPPGFTGFIDFRPFGNLPNENFGLAGNTGNILISTTGAVAGDAYTLILRIRKG